MEPITRQDVAPEVILEGHVGQSSFSLNVEIDLEHERLEKDPSMQDSTPQFISLDIVGIKWNCLNWILIFY